LGTGIWDGVDILREFLKDHITSFQMCGIVFRTQVLREIGGFPIDFSYTMDVACWAPLFFKGRARLVHEWCATHVVHGASQTAGLAIAVRVDEIGRVAKIIRKAVDHSTVDRNKRTELKVLAKQFCARKTLGLLIENRNRDVNFTALVSLLWWSRRN